MSVLMVYGSVEDTGVEVLEVFGAGFEVPSETAAHLTSQSNGRPPMTQQTPSERIVVATDGSAMHNEGPGGWEWVTTRGTPRGWAVRPRSQPLLTHGQHPSQPQTRSAWPSSHARGPLQMVAQPSQTSHDSASQTGHGYAPAVAKALLTGTSKRS